MCPECQVGILCICLVHHFFILRFFLYPSDGWEVESGIPTLFAILILAQCWISYSVSQRFAFLATQITAPGWKGRSTQMKASCWCRSTEGSSLGPMPCAPCGRQRPGDAMREKHRKVAHSMSYSISQHVPASHTDHRPWGPCWSWKRQLPQVRRQLGHVEACSLAFDGESTVAKVSTFLIEIHRAPQTLVSCFSASPGTTTFWKTGACPSP